MLATFGLGRLEAGLEDDTVSAEDVVAVLERARADCAKPAARTLARDAYEFVDDGYSDAYAERLIGDAAEDLPVRVFIHHGSNPEFQPTRHAYRV